MGTLYMNFINKIFTSYEVGFLKGTINRFYWGGPRTVPAQEYEFHFSIMVVRICPIWSTSNSNGAIGPTRDNMIWT